MTKLNLSEIEARAEKATKVVAWYAHTEDDTIRGPYGRWFKCDGGDNGRGGPAPVAEISDDVAYCAMAMNSVPALIACIKEMKEALKKIAAPREIIKSRWCEGMSGDSD